MVGDSSFRRTAAVAGRRAERRSHRTHERAHLNAEAALQRLWTRLRTAVLARDRTTIVSLTRFPFFAAWGNGGAGDEDVRRDFDRVEFLGVLENILAMPASVQGLSIRALIETRPTLMKPGALILDVTNVGPLQLVRAKGAWRLAGVFVEDVEFGVPAPAQGPKERATAVPRDEASA